MNIKKEKMLPHPPEKIWKALTETDALSSWLMVTDFKAEVGQPFNFKYKDTVAATGEVLEIVAPKKLVYSWKQVGIPTQTTVTWLLEATEGGTILRLEHDGFEDQAMLDMHNTGWIQCLDKLEKLLNGPVAK